MEYGDAQMGETIDMADTESNSCVVFGVDGYYEKMFAGLNKIHGLQYCNKELSYHIQKYPAFRILFRLTCSRVFRRIFGEKISNYASEYWFRYEYNRSAVRTPKTLFLFLQNNHLAHNIKFLNYLKEKYPEGKTVFWLTNTLEGYPENLEFLRTNYDLILTFSKKDAAENGFLYHNWCYQRVDIVENIDSDVFFCGWDKGRADLIEKVYIYLSSMGIKCDFTILSSEYRKDYVEGIVYTQKYIPYEIVFEKMKKTKCILEIVPGKEDPSPTLRWAESIALSKKLLTNNNRMEEAYINKHQIGFFTAPEDINVSWIKLEDRAYFTDADKISPVSFVRDVYQSSFCEIVEMS